ncbi:MerR family DNA-binding transcriptional regulator, partial [Clostridium aestuarii]
MFKIGDFARFNKVTVKTLRHYEKVGLLMPIYVDQY